MSMYMNGSATLDLASMADGNAEDANIAVVGAALGDYVDASLAIDVTGLQVTAGVTAANVVTVTVTNNTGGTLDIASTTAYVRVTGRASLSS